MKQEQYKKTPEFKADMIDLAILIKTLREGNGLSQRDLYIKSGITYSHICNLENAKTSTNFVTLSKLFNAMGYSIADAYSLIPCSFED